MSFESFSSIFIVLLSNDQEDRVGKFELELSSELIFIIGDKAAEHLSQLPILYPQNPTHLDPNSYLPSIRIPPNLLLLLTFC